MKLHITSYLGIALLFINVVFAIKCTNIECLKRKNANEIKEVYVN